MFTGTIPRAHQLPWNLESKSLTQTVTEQLNPPPKNSLTLYTPGMSSDISIRDSVNKCLWRLKHVCTCLSKKGHHHQVHLRQEVKSDSIYLYIDLYILVFMSGRPTK